MVDVTALTINIILATFSVIVLAIFWFTWRKRPDLVYWFISLIIFTIGHTLLIFKQQYSIFVYLGNGALLIALLVVVISTFIEYYSLMIKSQEDKQIIKKEKIILGVTISLTLLSGVITITLLQVFSVLNFLVLILILMIDLLIPVTIFVLRIYWKQKTTTRLFMFIVFFVGALTALSTIIALYYEWGVAANYAMNFIFITLIMTAGIAAPIEQRITNSEEEYRLLSEHLEEKVAERTQQLEEVNTELKAFSYTVSHDLRAPLRSIMGFSNILGEDYSQVLDNKGKDYLERIIKSSHRMNEMIDDLLTLAQISRTNINLEDINLSELAHDIMEDLLQGYPEQKVDFQIQENITANCDEKFIRIVLENLLGNALKFSIAKPNPKIIFGMDKLDNRTVYYIKDNGAGFDMNYYNKLFGLFQRLHNSTEFEGTGIGLITVKRIIDRHNGKIWAEGEMDKGATFYFTLS